MSVAYFCIFWMVVYLIVKGLGWYWGDLWLYVDLMQIFIMLFVLECENGVGK